MAIVETPSSILEELAGFLTSDPDCENLLNFRPSEEVQQRARILLEKLEEQTLSREEQIELEQFQNIELLMRLIKAKVQAENPS
ncbi:MAG: hypothetical protein IID46_11605 [Planctomycetes bacterium]|nr:hypothetical protein [Planctomycetota bacterium]